LHGANLRAFCSAVGICLCRPWGRYLPAHACLCIGSMCVYVCMCAMMQRWAHLILPLGQPLQPLQSLLLRQTLMMNPAGINRARFIRCRFARNGAFALFVLVNAGRDASYLTAYAPDGPGRAWSLVKKVSRVGWGQLGAAGAVFCEDSGVRLQACCE